MIHGTNAMNDLTKTPSPKLSVAYSANAEMTVELAKMLALVMPISMSGEQQELWLRAAVDSLQEIRPMEVAAISAELRRSVTRPSQIVPEIARLVDERRKGAARNSAAPVNADELAEMRITEEAQKRRGRARNQDEIEAAWSHDIHPAIRWGCVVRYLDVCSGISAPTAAWKPLGWQALCFAEIEAAPRAILAHHYPDVPLNGDFTKIEGTEYGPVDLLVGGTPCQSFSVAGLRGGLGDDRGNLALEYLRLADRARPRWLVWENVPGVLSSNGGRDFGAILGGMVELGYGVAYRVLDAQFFGVPQRRRRVFVVGHLGDWRRAAAVLFERHSLSGDTPPRREKGQNAPGDIAGSLGSRGNRSHTELDGHGAYVPTVAHCLETTCDYYSRADGFNMVAHSLRAEGFDASEEGTGRGTPLVPVCIHSDAASRSGDCKESTRAPGLGIIEDGTSYSMMASGPHCIAFAQNSRDEVREIGGNIAGALAAEPGMKQQTYICFSAQMSGTQASEGKDDLVPSLQAKNPMAVAFTASEQANSYAWERDVYPTLNAQIPNDSSNIQQGIRLGSAVRRLTPRECERLQGFPDNFTLVPYRKGMMADGPRYKALGNSMAVPVVRWIGERIQAVEAIAAAMSEAA
jgi:DNA (cytosine-5)-methyltransferase 1